MVKRSYFDPHPTGMLSGIFRFWAHLKWSPLAMETELNRQIETGGIEISPSLPRNWQLQQWGFEFTIKDLDDEWAPVVTYKYRILRWEPELYGPEKAVPVGETSGIVARIDAHCKEHKCSTTAACEALYRELHHQSAGALNQAYYRARRIAKPKG